MVQASYARRFMYTWVATVVRKGEFPRNTKFARPCLPARPRSGAERGGSLDWVRTVKMHALDLPDTCMGLSRCMHWTCQTRAWDSQDACIGPARHVHGTLKMHALDLPDTYMGLSRCMHLAFKIHSWILHLQHAWILQGGFLLSCMFIAKNHAWTMIVPLMILGCILNIIFQDSCHDF